MRQWILAAAASLALLGAAGSANALPFDRFTAASVPNDVEQAQFFYGGRNYCWYDDGWHGPGYYWCGYAFRRGLGWGGAEGWRGWHRGGGHVVVVRPGRPAMGRPGGHVGGGHPGGGGHGGGDHHH
jgi:hypothetical protein